MKERIKDDLNICIKCKYARIYGKDKEDRTFCGCLCPNLTGVNKGYRRKCKSFTRK